jgi:hypothetical protein
MISRLPLNDQTSTVPDRFRASHILDAILHLGRFEKLPNQGDSAHDLANRTTLGRVEDDPPVHRSRGIDPEKIRILRDDDTSLPVRA